MLKSILYILLYAAFNVSGAALIKWQLKGKSLTTLSEWLGFMFNFYFVVAFIMIILSALSLFKALSTNNFSLIIPIANGINFILTVMLGYYLFQDKLSFMSFVGFVLIIGGIVVLSLNTQVHA
jgi:multidrug transporter EmrE-like cation transporter